MLCEVVEVRQSGAAFRLDDRHVEELIGKTWTKKDRAPVAGLDLLEVRRLYPEARRPEPGPP